MRPALIGSSLVLLSLAACGGEAKGPAAAAAPKIAFVSNCVAEFWTIAAHGVDAARAGRA